MSAVKERPPLSWTARRRGGKRCAPACGRGCTQAEYERAKAFADRIAKRLGKGWRGEVWENMGWHSKAAKGKLDVSGTRYPDGSEYYLASADDYGVLGRGNTPRRALLGLVGGLNSRIEQARATLADHADLIKKAS